MTAPTFPSRIDPSPLRRGALRLASAGIVAAAVAVGLVAGQGAAHSRGGDTGAVAGAVVIKALDGQPKRARGGVVVSLDGVPGARPKPMRTEMGQRDRQFEPSVLVVTRGSTVSFPNHDKIFHNVFSVSPAARFDLGLYKSGESKEVSFRRGGDVDVFCNIHPEMAARIRVVDTRFYAVTAPDGSFRIEGVPAGTYPVQAWYADGDGWKGEVTITAGGDAKVEPTVTESRRRRHARKDGTPYGRYK